MIAGICGVVVLAFIIGRITSVRESGNFGRITSVRESGNSESALSHLPEPPFVLTEGRGFPGSSSIYHVKFEGDLVTIQGVRISLQEDEDWQYEIRPIDGDRLKVRAVMEEQTINIPGILGSAPQTSTYSYPSSIQWVEQPYEILDKDLRVVYSYPKGDSIGVQRPAVLSD